jgi:ectoine hydroxylase-related dioxygenase (phytanoyl-CoA dioxygenase family)
LEEQSRREIKEGVKPYRTEAGQIIRLDQLSQRNPVYRELIEHPVILDALESLLGPNIEFQIKRHNHLTLNRRGDNLEGQGGMGFHADSLQWSRPIVTVIVYLDEATVENGATQIIPGTHMLPYLGMPPGGRGGNWLADHHEYLDLLGQAVPVPMRKGGVLLFHSLLFHSTGVNTTDRSRVSITLGYRAVDELSRDGVEVCELVRGSRLYRGNDVDVETGNWRGGIEE